MSNRKRSSDSVVAAIRALFDLDVASTRDVAEWLCRSNTAAHNAVRKAVSMGFAFRVGLAALGRLVVPCYGATNTDVDKNTAAPLLYTNKRKLVAPDLLCVCREKGSSWQEVKSKTEPTWRRFRPRSFAQAWRARWEHGLDMDLVEHYSDVALFGGFPLYVIVHEAKSPINDDQESDLAASDKFLFAALTAIQTTGDHRPDWPGGKLSPRRRGRGGKGGWLWPRSIMREVKL